MNNLLLKILNKSDLKNIIPLLNLFNIKDKILKKFFIYCLDYFARFFLLLLASVHIFTFVEQNFEFAFFTALISMIFSYIYYIISNTIKLRNLKFDKEEKKMFFSLKDKKIKNQKIYWNYLLRTFQKKKL